MWICTRLPKKRPAPFSVQWEHTMLGDVAIETDLSSLVAWVWCGFCIQVVLGYLTKLPSDLYVSTVCTQAQTHSHIYMYTNTHAHIPCIDTKITNKCKMEHKEGLISYFVLGGTKSKADLTDAVFWQWTQWLASSCSCWMSSPSMSNSQTTSDSSVRGDKLLAVLNYKALG